MTTAGPESRIERIPITLNNNRTSMGKSKNEKKTYTLTYFVVRGRGEPIRMMFILAGVPFEDRRIEYSDWADIKNTTPYGQLPTLEIYDGGMKKAATLCQSHTILRYISREFGLGGSTPLQEAKVDEITEVSRDAISPIETIFNEKDTEKVISTLEKFKGESGLPKYLKYLQNKLEKNGWFLDTISAADVYVYITFDNISLFLPNFLDGYDILQAWKDRFESDDRISSWLERRPVTKY